MSARSQFLQLVTKLGTLVGALFVVTVLLAAMPGHHTPVAQSQEPPHQPASHSQQQSPGMDSSMPGMDMDDAKANEAHAVHDMTPGHHQAHNPHMHMTAPRPPTPEDNLPHPAEPVQALRTGGACRAMRRKRRRRGCAGPAQFLGLLGRMDSSSD